MLGWKQLIVLLAFLSVTSRCWPYDPEQVGYNLNENNLATNPADYWGEWPNHQYFPSPDNWRFPFYSLFLDRFVNGDPNNDNVNGTSFEHDLSSNQMRHGGDAAGLIDTLDYLQGMGIKGIYLAGTILMNQPWDSHGYSALDTTLLDRHFGDIEIWRSLVKEIHKRGMYILLDNTMATLGDLVGFEGYLNETTPFQPTEHKAQWKFNRRYADFDIGNEYNESCDYPELWLETGYPAGPDITSQLKGCYDSEFNQYGDTEAFGHYPDWQRQLTKFASVQDRLREWVPSVRNKITRHSCLLITQLDIDGFRYDKATQATVDALGDMSSAYRECAAKVGKHNFFLPGEITGGNTFGSIYIGRGRRPDMHPKSLEDAVRMTNESNEKYFIREPASSALDSSAFHYSIYRSLTRFLGMDGNLAAGYDTPVNWATAWYQMLLSNDFVNANTGKFDPRHMYGATNQDVFRWPAITQGTERMLLGIYITTLHLPGIPLLLWGEEQAFYTLDNTATNYLFGRQAMSSATAWQTHGCYNLGAEEYYDWPIDTGLRACHDDSVSYDHRDPSHPVRNILKSMHQVRENFPALNDGWYIEQLSNKTRDVYYPGSNNTPTETGMWSVLRGPFEGVQDERDQPVWLVYQNDNKMVNYTFDCNDRNDALVSVFDAGTTVKNLLHPYDELTLKEGPVTLEIGGSKKPNGCLDSMQLYPWDFRAYVPKEDFIAPKPMITRFTPGHDARLKSLVRADGNETVPVEIFFSTEMKCESVTNSIEFNSTTENGMIPSIDIESIRCRNVIPEKVKLIGEIPGVWRWSANIQGVYNGIHQLTVKNATSMGGDKVTDSIDHFLFRIGQEDNPMVFTRYANYSNNLLHKDKEDNFYVSHHAAGADLYRYTLDWGSTYSGWLPYKGGNDTLERSNWSGTKRQEWVGGHVSVEYWNRMAGSSDHVQHGDTDWDHRPPRRFPHFFWNGPYNQYGYDAGLENELKLDDDGKWKFKFMTEWPAITHLNVWGTNPDGRSDQSYIFGDSNNDSVVDRLPPGSLSATAINLTQPPPSPYLAWLFVLDDSTLRFELHPIGSKYQQLALYIILWITPIITASVAIYLFKTTFYQVKLNQVGISRKKEIIPPAVRQKVKRCVQTNATGPINKLANKRAFLQESSAFRIENGHRRMVLISTMEYDIGDWGIKIKIGGLGVMAQLMGQNLGHQDLIWVVPCVGDVVYPIDQEAEPMYVTILNNSYEVKVQYHTLRNITYVLLDAPIFRKQTKNNPYPQRMDDLDSAVYYSAWNQCIALAIKRFPVDLYHINDYHGSLALIYLLPNIIPACLSLHNAEFQGLWPMRIPKEKEEVCSIFNIDRATAAQYIQFGQVFNLLHAAASYLRIHQQGFGVVGVSKKYGKRSYARYPIFWGLKNVGNLPNPDPSDTAKWDNAFPKDSDIAVDATYEASRGRLRCQAQEWAGLKQDPDAELLVFVGRWSMQKGVDLIADVLPPILEARKNVQVLCVGPVIDLHGKFAALKLARLMTLYPGRVFSKPHFTALPPYVFSGAEFALIPSRDEPFGLVAVEFGRKGALGIGARVGGLGQMPGWWYTVESTTCSHLLHQLKSAIDGALNSKKEVRAKMRARSARQRFPVARWIEDLEVLQETAIKIRQKYEDFRGQGYLDPGYTTSSDITAPSSESSGSVTPTGIATPLSSLSDANLPHPTEALSNESRRLSSAPVLSVHSIVGEKQDYNLQKTEPLFTDVSGEFSTHFEKLLQNLDVSNTENQLCIEEYLVKSQKKWYSRVRDAKLGRNISPASSELPEGSEDVNIPAGSIPSEDLEAQTSSSEESSKDSNKARHEFSLGDGYVVPRGPKKWMLFRVGDWPIYSLFLGFGQIIAANSYQITLLTGEVGQSAEKLYGIATTYLITSCFWWIVFRSFKSVIPLSAPFAFYGLAFLLIGLAHFAPSEITRAWVQNIGSGVYAAASSSGSIFFALNFGDESGAPVQDWIYRACVIQGTQQIYVVALWYWGTALTRANSAAIPQVNSISNNWKITAITIPIAAFLWATGILIYVGLPDYYRQAPGKVPSFYKSLIRRKIILWLFVAVGIQNFFLSAPYGRNWSFLWSSNHAQSWHIALLVVFFFGLVWAGLLSILSRMSTHHSWILPVFAIGLGAPRWAQIWWGTSNVGQYLPWAGGYVSGAITSRCLWLWLGVLDSIQGVGLGMILLQTLTRTHICFTLLGAQIFGSLATISARSFGPNKLGPSTVHPDISVGIDSLWTPWFWIGLSSQLLLCGGFFLFFRKEQLSKP